MAKNSAKKLLNMEHLKFLYLNVGIVIIHFFNKKT